MIAGFTRQIWQKLTTKPVWWWERKRHYSICSDFYQLPHMLVEKRAERFVVLTTSTAVGDALWAAWSWYRFLRHQFELQLVVDGRLSSSQEQAARRLFPGLQIFDAASLLVPFRKQMPKLAPFLERHPLGKKLGLILALQQDGAILYSDHDVLAFNQPSEILSKTAANIPFYIAEEKQGCFDQDILERAQSFGLNHAPDLNSGLLWVPQGRLSPDLAAQLLEGGQPPAHSWFTEQTVVSVLMHQAGAHALPRERYVVSNQRQFYWDKDVDYTTIAARHFTGTTRHVMYRRGLPRILQQGKHFCD